MIPGSANPLLLASAAEAGPYQIERSLRFNSSDSAYLSRTPSSAGNRKTWTLSLWLKRSKLGDFEVLFGAGDASSEPNFDIDFGAGGGDSLRIRMTTGGGTQEFQLKTTQVFRDLSSWYHILVAFDTTQSTASNRIKLYVNGSQVTAFSTEIYPSQNLDTWINATTYQHVFGRLGAYSSYYLNGYLADCYLIDGQALTPSSFTEVSATTGQLIPKAYTGSFGTNGFWLKFSDNSAATATTLGKDYSGNGNNWTPNNLSVTAGAGNDSLVDTPTNGSQTDTGVGGEVVGNYCTWNPLYVDTSNNLPPTFANGNLDVSWRTGDWNVAMGTIKQSSGKWYWEMTLSTGNRCMIGITKYNTFNSANAFYYSPDVYVYFSSNGNKLNNNTQTAYGASFVQGDVIGVALDLDAGTLVFYKNGVSQGTAFSSLSGNFAPVWGTDTTGNTHVANFGQRPFAYTAPSGFKALCTQNLPDPLVAKPSTVMDVALYTGNGSTQTISGLEFSPDWVWIKSRSGADNHAIQDAVRGATYVLQSNTTNAEVNAANTVGSFTSDGFTLAGGAGSTNGSSVTYAAWCWDAGSSTVPNEDGSITSQVRANPSAGFSIATFTNVSGTQSVGHGLGVPPHMVILRYRDRTSDWAVYHKTLGPNYYVNLNTTAAAVGPVSIWGNGPTSSVVELTGFGQNGFGQIMYSFAPVDGYSSFGSYTGNGSADGPFVYTGFRPRWILLRSTSGSRDWLLYDTARGLYNPQAEGPLQPNTSNTPYGFAGYDGIDILSNGFKLRTSINNINANTEVHVWAAFAESPFKTARAR